MVLRVQILSYKLFIIWLFMVSMVCHDCDICILTGWYVLSNMHQFKVSIWKLVVVRTSFSVQSISNLKLNCNLRLIHDVCDMVDLICNNWTT